MNDELNLEGWGDFGGMMVATWDELQQDNGVPILDEYCWMHTQQPGGGGWTCPYCYEEQQQTSKRVARIALQCDSERAKAGASVGLLHIVQAIWRASGDFSL